MQGCDLLNMFLSDVRHEAPVTTARPEHKKDRPADTWTLHTPPLKYEVASLQHWVDLNA